MSAAKSRLSDKNASVCEAIPADGMADKLFMDLLRHFKLWLNDLPEYFMQK